MSLEIVSRAAQFSHASSPSLFKPVIDTVFHELKGISLSHGLFGITPSQSLVNRVVLVSALGLRIATYILQRRSLRPYSSAQSEATVAFVCSLAAAGGAYNWVGCHFLIAGYALKALIEFKNTCSVLPYLDDPASQPSRIGKVAYSAIKYVTLMGIALGAFKACQANFFNGVLLGSIVGLLYLISDFTKNPYSNAKTRAEIQLEIVQTVGNRVAAGLLLTAIAAGAGGSLAWSGALSCATAVTTRDLAGFLWGVRNISMFLGVIFPLFTKAWSQFHLIDDHSCQFFEHYCYALSRAQRNAVSSNRPVTQTHLKQAYYLALAYSAKKTDPQQRQVIIEILKDIPADEIGVCFQEHQLFFDKHDLQDFIQACGIQAFHIWPYLSPKKIQKLIFPRDIDFSEPGLRSMEANLEAFEAEIKTTVKKYAKTAEEENELSDVDKAERELEIYKEIQTKHKKMMDDNSSLSDLLYFLNRMDPEKTQIAETRTYIERLRILLPQLTQLKEKVSDVEDLIDEYTGGMNLPVAEAIGGKGFTVADCNELLVTLGRPRSEQAYQDLTKLFVERGVKTKYDLIDKEIFIFTDTSEEFKVRLLHFLVNSDQPLPPAPVVSVPQKTVNVAAKIYRSIAIPFFTVLQIYSQPMFSLLGAVVLFPALVTIPSLQRTQEVLDTTLSIIPDRLLTSDSNFPISLDLLHLAISTTITVVHLTGLGPSLAILYGSQIPHKIITQVYLIRQALMPAH